MLLPVHCHWPPDHSLPTIENHDSNFLGIATALVGINDTSLAVCVRASGRPSDRPSSVCSPRHVCCMHACSPPYVSSLGHPYTYALRQTIWTVRLAGEGELFQRKRVTCQTMRFELLLLLLDTTDGLAMPDGDISFVRLSLPSFISYSLKETIANILTGSIAGSRRVYYLIIYFNS